MFADISHERQQTLLRQRNLFALTSAGLGIALFVATSLAATRDREVVLVPTVPRELTVSSAGVDADYLELVTRDTALVLLNRSPEGLDYWMDEILKLADPASHGQLKADLVKIVAEQRGSDVTQAFVIRSMTVDPGGLTSEVTGTYSAFFEGEASLALDSDFTVFEMSDLGAREELRAVVLSAIMFMTSQAMTRTPRQVRKLLLIDEAWSMLKGGSMGEFVETYARTCRKYGGALATATQSLNDYYKSDGATAALENSDWMLILQQKPETIADFKASKRLDMDDRTETLIRSLKRSGNDYSEVFIKGPEVEAIGRLVLDEYSSTLFSSSPDTFAAIDAEVARGHQLAEAIERIAFGSSS